MNTRYGKAKDILFRTPCSLPPSSPPSLSPYVSLLQVRLRQVCEIVRVIRHSRIGADGSGDGGAESLCHGV